MSTDTQTDFAVVVRDLRAGWKPLVATDVLYKLIAFVVLTPLVGVSMRVLLALTGNSLLADQDILFFFLGPVGWLSAMVVGGLWLGILALEQVALLAVLCAGRAGQRIRLLAALRFAKVHAWPVLQVTARIVGFTLLTVAPFLAAAGVTYAALLSEFDINFYLQQRPPEFLMAVGIGILLATGMAAALLWLCTAWFFAIPLVLFDGVDPAAALRTSRQRVRGQRRTIVSWIVLWAVATTVISGLATSLVVAVANLWFPDTSDSLTLLAAAVGATLTFSAGVNLAVNLLSTISFAAMLFHLYCRLIRQGEVDVASLKLDDTERLGVGFRLTRSRLIAACCVGAMAAVAVGFVTMRSVRLDDDTRVIAHRGASTVAPENTMAAFRAAIEAGTDWVELDVQETADGEVVVFHDSDFMKLAGRNLKIWDATMAELQQIDIGSWFDPEFKDERVPTLGQVLEECKGKVGVVIELKYYGHDVQLEQRVAEIVDAHGMAAEVEIMSLKLEAVQKMKALRPDWKVGLLLSVSAGNLNSSGADFLAISAGFVDRKFITSTHRLNKEAYVWTVNDAPTMSVMIGRGIDGLITDEPALAKSVLAQRADMSPLERLLIELAEILGIDPEIDEV